MGILVSKDKRQKKVSTDGVLSENRVIAVHIIKDAGSAAQQSGSSDDEGNGRKSEQIEFSQHATGAQQKVDEKVLSVLKGDLSNYAVFKAKIVRIFISSTFTDTAVERNALMKDVYPKLKKFCQEHGYQFQFVDMRWGIRDESTDEHETLELCISEIENCQKMSTGPSFLSLLSEKYGFRPIPARIPKEEFRTLSSVISAESEFELLLSWYYLDENHKPPVYVLQPISSRIGNFINYVDDSVRNRAVNEWLETMTEISRILRSAASLVLFGKEKRKYFASISEIEVQKGIIATNDLVHGCWWFKRNIDGLKEAKGEEAKEYLDVQDDESEETEMCIANLHNLLLNKMNPKNIKQYYVKWEADGISKENTAHASYLSQLCQDVYDSVSKAVEEKINERSQTEVNLAVFEEVSQHITFAKTRCESFQGRKNELEKIRTYLEGSDNYPLVVYGESGCGKTSILSMVLKSFQEWCLDDSAIVIRHLGITPDSSLLRRLLLSLCRQIALLIGRDYDPKQRKMVKVLADDFLNLLQLSKTHFKTENPLIIVLDSLDQLSPEDGAFQLTWLPTRLPPWVKMVISTITNDDYRCLENVKGLVPERFFVKVPRLPLDDAVLIVNGWLSANKRSLTEDQRDVLLGAFQKCSLPIFLKVSFEEALKWKSYSSIDEIRLESSVKGAINGLFERIERRHGRLFVSRSLAYITASKNGLTESELEDILSCDDEVLEDVFQYWVPPIRRIPPLLWLRVKHDLSSYLVDRGADESMVVTWYHRQFRNVANERYLSDKKERHYIHTSTSEFFLGRWANGVEKPFEDKDGSLRYQDRLVASQELVFSPEDHCHRGPEAFNLRKLKELPYQLAMAENVHDLKKECLCNYEFLLTQLRAFGLSEVLDNFELALSVWPNDKDLMTIHETMKLSTNALMLWPGQLASQLLSRIPKDSIMKSECLSLLEKQARSPSLPAVVPSSVCLASPGGPLLQSLSGSTEPHASLRLSSDGKTLVSIGEGSEALVWDVHAGRILRNIECPDGGTTHACLSSKGSIIVISRVNIIKAWLVSNGQPLFEIRGHDELAPISICVYQGEEVLAVYKSNTLHLIELENGGPIKQYVTVVSKYISGSSKVFLTSFEGLCLIVHKDDGENAEEHSLLVESFHISSRDKHEIFRLKTESDIIWLDVVISNQLLVTYVGIDEDLQKNRKPASRPSVASIRHKLSLELWDMETMKPTSRLTAADDSVRCSCVTPHRDEIIMLCNLSFIETASEYLCFVKIYSIADGKSFKLPLSFPSGIISMCGLGFKCIITASADKIIRVWDLERTLDADSRPQKQDDYVNASGKALNAGPEREADGINNESDTTLAKTSFSKSSKVVSREIDTSVISSEGSSPTVDKSDVSLNIKHDEESTLTEIKESERPSIASQKDETHERPNKNGWKKMKHFPVGRNFLKLRYSTLSSALQSCDIDSGESLEDLQVVYCHQDMIVYLARRMVDSVYGVVAWKLSTDVKMRISELQNPDACIVHGCKTDYFLILSNDLISVYDFNSGKFVKCMEINVDCQGTARLCSLIKDRILIVENGRRSLKVLNVPRLALVKAIAYGDDTMIVRTVCSHNLSFLVICLRKYCQNSTQCNFIAEVWDASRLEKKYTCEYGSFQSQFDDIQVSSDGRTVADIVFNPEESKYRLVVWKEDSQRFNMVPVDSSLSAFSMEMDGEQLIVGTWAGDLLLYDIKKLNLKRLQKAHIGPVHYVLVSETNNMALTIAGVFNSRDRSIRLWNTKSGKMITEYTPDVKVFPIAMTHNGKWIIVEIRGKLVKLELLSNEH